ncbi:hypothetical protein IMZ48_09940, partial [Candidatus Bathyarchaeota archaeon]|nr:hypothetical protein [Candidatus Bathyarchaeota archaeon]
MGIVLRLPNDHLNLQQQATKTAWLRLDYYPADIKYHTGGNMSPAYTNPADVPREGGPRVTTSYLLGNLHCPSCVSSIKHVLHETCDPDVLWVSPNIVTSVVTVEHRPTDRASVLNMTRALEDAGFEVEAVTSTATDDEQQRVLNRLSQAHAGDSSRDAVGGGFMEGWFGNRGQRPGHSRVNSAHIRNCQQCQSEQREPDVEKGGDGAGLDSTEKEAVGSLTTSPASARPSAAELESVGVVEDAPAWRATYAIGGMT